MKRYLDNRNLSKTDTTKVLLGYSLKDFTDKFPNIPKNYHIDHKIPISWFIQETPPNIINALDNLQLLQSTINIKKRNFYSDKISKEFYEKIIGFIKDKYKNNIHIG